MAAQTAIAPAGMRQLAPAGSSVSNRSELHLRQYQASASRPIKALTATSKPRSIALAPAPPLSKNTPALAALSISPSPITSTSSEASTATTKSTLGTRMRTDRANSEASARSSSTTTSRQVSASPFDDDSIIQPKKEWHLPARAKPGRKPSEVEPPTKRKAQNRASQRAFRERKQSYVASLEEKIEEYEKREVGMNSELQKLARSLKEENDELRKENAMLKSRVKRLVEQYAGNSRGIIENINASPSASDSVLPSPSSMDMPMDRDCGFCTEQSPCVCKGEAILDLEDEEEQSSAPKADDARSSFESVRPSPPLSSSNARLRQSKLWYTVPLNMGPPPLPPQICPTDSRSRLDIRYVGSPSNTLPPLQMTKSKLWPVYAARPSNNVDLGRHSPSTVPVYRLRKAPIDVGIEAACSGDPTNCNACSTDPALAAFCLAVTSHLSASSSTTANGSTVTPAILDAGNALPLRLKRKRSFDGPVLQRSILNPAAINRPSDVSLYTNRGVGGSQAEPLTPSSHRDTQTRQTIPEAWQRIKEHPSFPAWKGGLDLLADVVSKRSEATTESPRVDVQKSMSIVNKFSRKSNDRGADLEMKNKGAIDARRRRLYVNKESVEDALALLDHGSSQSKSCVCPLNRSL